jgi:autophagy-related protein 18
MGVFAGLTNTVGEIEIIHFDKADYRMKIAAHKSPITSIALNNDGSLVATASQKGQVIRIFRADNGKQL